MRQEHKWWCCWDYWTGQILSSLWSILPKHPSAYCFVRDVNTFAEVQVAALIHGLTSGNMRIEA